jgi:NTP pyrophosphatase (non-canonical NTP hydrolase)
MTHPFAELLAQVKADRKRAEGDIAELNDYQEQANALGLPGPYEARHYMVAALGLAGEAGEVADLYKKQFEQSREPTRAQLIGELGDVLWYIARIAALEDISLAEVANANLTKLRARYPNGFVPGGGVR